MASDIEWKDEFSIGVESIDKAHKQLFAVIRKLFNLVESKRNSKHSCIEGIKFLKAYTIKHFTDEENYMKSIKYKNYAAHKQSHENLKSEITRLDYEMEMHEYSEEIVQDFLGVCIGWLTSHVMIEDHQITGKNLADNTEHCEFLPDEKDENKLLASLIDSIIMVMKEVFAIDIEIKDSHYKGGGNARKKFYQRLSYSKNDGSKLKVLLIIDEGLLLKNTGNLANIKFKKVDATVTAAAMQITNKIMRRLGEYYNIDAGTYKLEKGDILKPELVEKGFSASYFDYSLLFGSELGCFAFCAKVI